MELIAKIIIGIVALEHLYILYMEMFAWETTASRKIFFVQAVPALVGIVVLMLLKEYSAVLI